MRCPICGADFPAREALMDSEWRGIIALLPTFGGQGKLVFEYVEKFGVNPLRIRSKKILRLLTEMSGLFRTGQFMYQRRKYSASKRVVIEAMTVVNNKHFSAPLENHNYLKKVMISLAEEEAREESKRKERELRLKEDRLRNERRMTNDDQRMTNDDQRMTNDESGCGRFNQQSSINNHQSGEMTGPEYLASIGKKSLRK